MTNWLTRTLNQSTFLTKTEKLTKSKSVDIDRTFGGIFTISLWASWCSHIKVSTGYHKFVDDMHIRSIHSSENQNKTKWSWNEESSHLGVVNVKQYTSLERGLTYVHMANWSKQFGSNYYYSVAFIWTLVSMHLSRVSTEVLQRKRRLPFPRKYWTNHSKMMKARKASKI